MNRVPEMLTRIVTHAESLIPLTPVHVDFVTTHACCQHPGLNNACCADGTAQYPSPRNQFLKIGNSGKTDIFIPHTGLISGQG